MLESKLLISYTYSISAIIMAVCLTCVCTFGTILYASQRQKHEKSNFKGRSASGLYIVQGVQTHMPIAVEFVSSRRKKIAVDVVPAEWQLYIAH